MKKYFFFIGICWLAGLITLTVLESMTTVPSTLKSFFTLLSHSSVLSLIFNCYFLPIFYAIHAIVYKKEILKRTLLLFITIAITLCFYFYFELKGQYDFQRKTLNVLLIVLTSSVLFTFPILLISKKYFKKLSFL